MFQIDRVVCFLKSSVGTHRITDRAYNAIIRAGKPITMELDRVINGMRVIKIDGIDDKVLLTVINDGREIYIDQYQDCGFCF